jgi:hypothetical protein
MLAQGCRRNITGSTPRMRVQMAGPPAAPEVWHIGCFPEERWRGRRPPLQGMHGMSRADQVSSMPGPVLWYRAASDVQTLNVVDWGCAGLRPRDHDRANHGQAVSGAFQGRKGFTEQLASIAYAVRR